MEQFNTTSLFLLGKCVRGCQTHFHEPLHIWVQDAQVAGLLLGWMVQGNINRFRLDESSGPAKALIMQLGGVVEKHKADPNQILDQANQGALSGALTNFDNAINLELGRSPIFYVSPKGVFSTNMLITDGAAVYEEFRDRVAEAIADTKESARCLAFGLATAAGFHIARATETIIVKYMKALNVTSKDKSWGKYIEALESSKADKRVVATLKQIKNLHRNPVLHPDQSLNMPEARSLWSICTAVIQSMVADMEKHSANPDPTITALLPPPPSDEVSEQQK